MGEVNLEFSGDRIELTGSVEAVNTFNAKGGGLNVKLQVNDDPESAAALVKNRQRIARVTFEFSEHKATKVTHETTGPGLDFDGGTEGTESNGGDGAT